MDSTMKTVTAARPRGQSARMALLLPSLFSLAFLMGGGEANGQQDPRDAELAALRARVAALEAAYLAEAERTPRLLPAVDPTEPFDESYLATDSAEPAAIRAEIEKYFDEKAHAEQEALVQAERDGHVIGSDLAMTPRWNHGLELSTKHKDFRLHLGGRTQFDTSWYQVNDNVQDNINVPYEDGIDFRRARLRVEGTLYEVMDWAVEYDFANAIRVRNAAGSGELDEVITSFSELWWTFKEMPYLGNLRIGNQREPIGFEHLSSSRFLPLLERSYNQDAFYGGTFNGFCPGVQAFHSYDDEHGSWALGVFKPVDNVFAYNATGTGHAVTGRITRLLWYLGEGNSLLHVGASGRQFSPVEDRIRYRTRDAVRSGISAGWPIPADTGNVFGDSGQWINGELAAVHGSWTVQGEYLVSFLNDARASADGVPSADALTYHGGYVQVFYFLTGEHDRYNRKTCVFERVIPHENAFLVDAEGQCLWGRGAWQMGARYNYLDLNDQGINGGQLHNGTWGLNWFLNPNTKVQFNYSVTHRDAPLLAELGDGWANGWGIRFAHDF